MATLILGPNDNINDIIIFDVSGVHGVNVKAIDVIVHQVGKESTIIKSPFIQPDDKRLS